MERIQAQTLVAFISCTLHLCLRRRLNAVASGLTPRAVLEKFCAVQMVDVYLPTMDGRTVILTRHTQPENELHLLPLITVGTPQWETRPVWRKTSEEKRRTS